MKGKYYEKKIQERSNLKGNHRKHVIPNGNPYSRGSTRWHEESPKTAITLSLDWIDNRQKCYSTSGIWTERTESVASACDVTLTRESSPARDAFVLDQGGSGSLRLFPRPGANWDWSWIPRIKRKNGKNGHEVRLPKWIDRSTLIQFY